MSWKRIKQYDGKVWRWKDYTIIDEWGDGSEWTLYYAKWSVEKKSNIFFNAPHVHFDSLKEAKEYAQEHYKSLSR